MNSKNRDREKQRQRESHKQRLNSTEQESRGADTMPG